jgi:hypothetical protein
MAYIKIIIISLLCVCIDAASPVYAFDMPDEIVQALESGDAKGISKYFDASVELIFSQNRNVYGKSQAEQILKNFFDKNRTGDFKYKHLHTNDKDNTQNYIGQLLTGKGTYRIYILMKDRYINQMRIENND